MNYRTAWNGKKRRTDRYFRSWTVNITNDFWTIAHTSHIMCIKLPTVARIPRPNSHSMVHARNSGFTSILSLYHFKECLKIKLRSQFSFMSSPTLRARIPPYIQSVLSHLEVSTRNQVRIYGQLVQELFLPVVFRTCVALRIPWNALNHGFSKQAACEPR